LKILTNSINVNKVEKILLEEGKAIFSKFLEMNSKLISRKATSE